jgi:hypothetical protein
MAKCWASILGDCDSISGEHIISAAILRAGCGCPPVVKGVKRIRGGAPTRGAEQSNILCRKHNSLLSPLDEIAGKLSTFQASASEEGELLERWLLKTMINSCAAGWAGPRKWLPSPEIVRMIFGHVPIPEGVGLYSVDGIDPLHTPRGGASFFAISGSTSDGPVPIGAYISVNGMPMLASLHPMLASKIEEGSLAGLTTRFSEVGLRHLYHPGAIVMSRKRGDPVIIGLSWKGYLRYADGSTEKFPRDAWR